MNKLKLVITEKGRYVEIPGISAFRTPAEVDVTKVKLAILIQSLHSGGISNYKIVSSDNKKERIYTEQDFKTPKKEIKPDEVSNRLDRMEELLLKLVSDRTSQKSNSSEQITNRLNRIERLMRKGQKIVYKDLKSGDTPLVEELEDQFIPDINVSEMSISGKTTEIVEKKSSKDIDDAVDLLSNLTKNGGK